MDNFIVASSKSWHKEEFNKNKNKIKGIWFYVERPEELNILLKTISPRYIFFLHWNWIVPSKLISNFECVCFHMTDLPYGRGGSPLQNLILEGKKHTKLTAFKMNNEIDSGPIYTKRNLELQGSAKEIYLEAGKISWDIIDWMVQESPIPEPQEGAGTYFKRRKPNQSLIPENSNLLQIYDFIRMLDAPTYPQAFLTINNLKLEFSNAKLIEGQLFANVSIKLNNE